MLRRGRRAAAAGGPRLFLLAGLVAGGGTPRQAERDVRLVLDTLAGGRFGSGWERQRLDTGNLEAAALLARLRRFAADPRRHHGDQVVLYLAGPGELRGHSEPLLRTATGTVSASELLAAAGGPGRLLLLLDLWTGGRPDPRRVRATAQRVAPPAPKPARRGPVAGPPRCELVLAVRERAGPGPSFAQVFVDALESPPLAAPIATAVPLPAAVEEADRQLRRAGRGVAVHRPVSVGTALVTLPNPNHRARDPHGPWLIPGTRAESEIRAWLDDPRALTRPLAVLNSPTAARPTLLWRVLHRIVGVREELHAGRMPVAALLAAATRSLRSEATTLGGLLDDLRARPAGEATVIVIDALAEAPDPELLLRDLVDPLIRFGGGRVRLVLGTDREQARRLTSSSEPGHQPVLLDLLPAETKRQAARSPLPPYPAPPDAGATELLLPVAYGGGYGLPWEGVWPALVDALRDGAEGKPDWERLTGDLRHELVADLLGGRSVYRLARPGLARQLRAGRERTQDESRITDTLLAQLPVRMDGTPDWAGAHPYTRRHLATHAAAAGRLDPLLADAGFLLHATRPELLDALHRVHSQPGRAARAAYLSPTVPAGGDPAVRAAALALAAAGTGATALARSAAGWAGGRSRVRWVRWRPPRPALCLPATGPVRSLALGDADHRPLLLAAADAPGNRPPSCVLSWDLRAGVALAEPDIAIEGHHLDLVTTARIDGRATGLALLRDGRLLRWDLASGRPGPVRRLGRGGAAAGRLGARSVLVVAGRADPPGRLEAWDPATGHPVVRHGIGDDRYEPVVATVRIGTRTVVAAANGHPQAQGPRGIVLRDLRTGRMLTDPLEAEGVEVTTLAFGRVEDTPVLLAGTARGAVEIWELDRFERLGEPLPVHPCAVTALACTSYRDRPLAVVATGDEVSVWDLLERQQLAAPVTLPDPVRALALTRLDDRELVAAGTAGASVRVWDLFGDGEQLPAPDGVPGPVRQVAVIPGPEPLLLTRHRERSRLPAPGPALTLRRLSDGEGVPAGVDGTGSRPLWVGPIAGAPGALLAGNGTVRTVDLRDGRELLPPVKLPPLWLPAAALADAPDGPRVLFADGRELAEYTVAPGGRTLRRRVLEPRHLSPGPLITALLGSRPWAAAAVGDTVRLWDLAGQTPVAGLQARRGERITALALGGQDDDLLLVAGTEAGTLTAWPLSRLLWATRPVRARVQLDHPVRALALGDPAGVLVGTGSRLLAWQPGRDAPEPLAEFGGPVHTLAAHPGPAVAIVGTDDGVAVLERG